MADNQVNIILRAKFAWWLIPYLQLLKLAVLLSGREPDWDKLAKVVDRATKISIANK